MTRRILAGQGPSVMALVPARPLPTGPALLANLPVADATHDVTDTDVVTAPVVEDTVGISVVIPTYNEQRRVGASIDSVCAYLRAGGLSWELVVVDDGSTDGTAAIAAAAAVDEPNIRIIRTPRNHGKGHAVRTGVLASRGQQVLISDADLSVPIQELDRLLHWPGRWIMAIGSRMDPDTITAHQSRLRETLGHWGNRIIRAFAVSDISDTQCGFKLFDGPAGRALFAMAKVDRWAFDVEILHLCERFGWPVEEVPVTWAHAAGSKVRPLAYLGVLADVISLRVRHRRSRPPMLVHRTNGQTRQSR